VENKKLTTRKTIAVLISGPAGVGKSTIGNKLVRFLLETYNANAEVFSFATHLKRLARAAGWDGTKDAKGRRFLQGLGELARAYNENVWVSFVMDRLIPSLDNYPLSVIVIDDWRYKNEASYIMDNPLYSVVTVNIVDPSRETLRGTPEYNHISERNLDYYKFDLVLENVSDLSSLGEVVNTLWNFIKTNQQENIK